MLKTKSRRALIGLAIPVLAVAGCNDFLTGDDRLTENPNNPGEASIDNLYNAAQVNIMNLMSGELARAVSIWMQQMMGTERQYLSYSVYDVDTDAFEFDRFYAGGGLIDLRRIQERAEEAGDPAYGGYAKILEAYLIGTAADLWGDIPYRNALDPDAEQSTDSQLQVYADLQTVLDEAITGISSADASDGPGGVDLFFEGNHAAWIEVANTLKARYFLHAAEVEGATAYENAFLAAQRGISRPEHDFRTYQSQTPRETNTWYQFMVEQRIGYISAGQYLVDLLKSRSDPRLSGYYSTNDEGEYVGASTAATSSAGISSLSEERIAKDFRQPLITWAENQLILAEAALQTGRLGDAQAALDAVRSSVGLPSVPATLENIMTEKYIVNFQNVETWSDWRRTCIPNLPPAAGTDGVPRRLFYPAEEVNVNPLLVDPTPAAGDPPAGRNRSDPGDPAGCIG